MKKILFLITKANAGGAQRYVYDLASSLPKERLSISVAYGQGGALAEKLKAAGIPTFQIRQLERDLSLNNDIASFFALTDLFTKEKPDIVHLNSSKAAGIGALAARITGVPRVIFTVHGWPFGEKRNPLARALIYLASWISALLSDRVICVSKYDLSLAKRMPLIGSKAVLIYNGIRKDEAFGSGDVIRRAFPDGARITGTIGELNHNKNQIALIEEAKASPNMYVAIVGEGENREYLEWKIAEYGLMERVKLFGFLPAAEVLKGFDTFALPSLKEGLPYVLLEARAAGIPIVAKRVGGVGEILDAPSMETFSLEKMVKETIAVYER